MTATKMYNKHFIDLIDYFRHRVLLKHTVLSQGWATFDGIH